MAAVFGFVCLTWVFFRANNLHDAWYVLSHLHVGLGEQFSGRLAFLHSVDALGRRDVALSLWALLALHLGEWRMGGLAQPPTQPLGLAWCWAHALVWALVLFGVYEDLAFIYFQF